MAQKARRKAEAKAKEEGEKQRVVEEKERKRRMMEYPDGCSTAMRHVARKMATMEGRLV